MDHEHYMRLAMSEAERSPPKPTNYCVGAVLVDSHADKILATGYTLELPGNTHAEQCCLHKFAEAHGLPEERAGEALRPEMQAVLYTTMEPCVERLSGNLPCVERLIRTRAASNGHGHGIQKVFTGVEEPDTFVAANSSRQRLESSGIECALVPGFADRILQIATAGHEKQ